MIVITGATGFIGVYLVDELIREGFDVLATGRNQVAKSYYNENGIPFVGLDVTSEEDFNRLPKNNIDAVVHLAALIPAATSSLNAKGFLIVNSLGTYNALDFCRRNGINDFIFTTSHFTVEGFWGIWDTKKLRIKEEMGRNFKYTGDHTLYIISKIAAEEYVERFSQEYGMRCITFRLSGVWGYGRYETGFEFFVNRAKKGKTIEVFGDPNKVRDNIYVKDVTRAIILGLESRNAKGLYNLSSGIPLTLREEVEKIVEAFSPVGSRSRIVSCPDKPGGVIKSYVYDISKIREEIGFTPEYPYELMLLDYKEELEKRRFGWLRQLKIRG